MLRSMLCDRLNTRAKINLSQFFSFFCCHGNQDVSFAMETDEETLACISRPLHDGIEGFWCNLIVEHYSTQSRSNLYINLSCNNILGFVKNTIFFSEIFTYFPTKIFIAKKVQ